MINAAKRAGRAAASAAEAIREAVYLSGARDVEDLRRRLHRLETGRRGR